MSIPFPKLRAIVDTGLFVSGLIVRGGSLPGRLIDAPIDGSFTLVTSSAIDAEVAEVLERPRLTERYHIDPTILHLLLDRIAIAEHVIPLDTLSIAVRDPKDAKFLACALAGGVDYLVSGDTDLLVLDGDPTLRPLRIVTVRAFLDVLSEHRDRK
jgi:putative PIN family toxin of toxin-antitoxin system